MGGKRRFGDRLTQETEKSTFGGQNCLGTRREKNLKDWDGKGGGNKTLRKPASRGKGLKGWCQKKIRGPQKRRKKGGWFQKGGTCWGERKRGIDSCGCNRRE